MPVVALACRLAAWFVLGASLAGAVYFLRFDGLGVAVAGFLVVQGTALTVGLWAVGRIAAETARIARRLAPPPPSTGWRPFSRHRTPEPAAPREAPRPVPEPPVREATAREMTADELADFFGRPESLAAHRARQRGADRG